jgi:hypothetical protein
VNQSAHPFIEGLFGEHLRSLLSSFCEPLEQRIVLANAIERVGDVGHRERIDKQACIGRYFDG